MGSRASSRTSGIITRLTVNITTDEMGEMSSTVNAANHVQFVSSYRLDV